MVSYSRAPLGTRDLRPLNAPTPLRVFVASSGEPRAVQRVTWPAARQVTSVQDRWRIDDEWWRENPISRLYYNLQLIDGTLLTLYHDLVGQRWYEQHG